MWDVVLVDSSPEDTYATPEEAALAEWERIPGAQARVVEVLYVGQDEAIVITETVPSHEMNNYCRKVRNRWEHRGDSS